MAGRHFGKNVGSEVMEAWDVIVLGDGPAALHAAAEAAKEGANTLLMSATGLGEPGMAPLLDFQPHFKSPITAVIARILSVVVNSFLTKTWCQQLQQRRLRSLTCLSAEA